MPSRNSLKVYVENGCYHLYNRGVEKRNIFEDAQDYKVFLKYFKEYLLSPLNPKDLIKTFTLKGQTFKGVPRPLKNFAGQIELLAYCLMPNHFHLLLKQNSQDAMRKFVQSLITRYSMYFNKKYKRVGPLFQGRYKAVLINEEPYLLHLTRYIHLNPAELTHDLINTYSSYADYLKIRQTKWLHPNPVLSFFEQGKLSFLTKVNSYKDFVESYQEDSQKNLGNLTLET